MRSVRPLPGLSMPLKQGVLKSGLFNARSQVRFGGWIILLANYFYQVIILKINIITWVIILTAFQFFYSKTILRISIKWKWQGNATSQAVEAIIYLQRRKTKFKNCRSKFFACFAMLTSNISELRTYPSKIWNSFKTAWSASKIGMEILLLYVEKKIKNDKRNLLQNGPMYLWPAWELFDLRQDLRKGRH